jgi:hypothetical protein
VPDDIQTLALRSLAVQVTTGRDLAGSSPLCCVLQCAARAFGALGRLGPWCLLWFHCWSAGQYCCMCMLRHSIYRNCSFDFWRRLQNYNGIL